MPPLVVLKLLPSAKTCGTNVNAFVASAYRICTFDSDSVRQVTCARIALILLSRFIHGCTEHAMRLADMESRGKAWKSLWTSSGMCCDFRWVTVICPKDGHSQLGKNVGPRQMIYSTRPTGHY
jgi:hypothetical protein